MYGTDENSGLLDANRRRGVGGVPMALQAAMLGRDARFRLHGVPILASADLQMLPSWKTWFQLQEGRIGAPHARECRVTRLAVI